MLITPLIFYAPLFAACLYALCHSYERHVLHFLALRQQRHTQPATLSFENLQLDLFAKQHVAGLT